MDVTEMKFIVCGGRGRVEEREMCRRRSEEVKKSRK